MSKYSLAHLSQGAVLSGVKTVLANERGNVALVLAHLGEIEAHEYFKPAGYSSMHMYCVHELHFSKDAAKKRVRAARLAREYPAIFARVAQGALRLTSLLILGTIEPIGEQVTLASPQESVAEHAEGAAQPLQGVVNPLQVKKFGAPGRQRRGRRSKSAAYVSREVKRKVWERDGGRCTFVSEDGARCPETRGLEDDHIVPVARGGTSEPSNLRLRCRAHNQLEAERTFGKPFMEIKREQARAEAAKRRAEKEAKRAAKEALDNDELMPGLRGLGCTIAEARSVLAKVGPMQGFPIEARLKRCLSMLAAPHQKVAPSGSVAN